MAAWIKMPLRVEVGLGAGDFVLDGDAAPTPKNGAEPPLQFLAHVYCGQTAGWLLDGDPAPSPKRGLDSHLAEPPRPFPQFSAHFYCGPTAGCIKMPLGMEVGLSTGDFVSD